jgi:hypothetical protein
MTLRDLRALAFGGLLASVWGLCFAPAIGAAIYEWSK